MVYILGINNASHSITVVSDRETETKWKPCEGVTRTEQVDLLLNSRYKGENKKN